MKSAKPKVKILSFRVTEKEFKKIKAKAKLFFDGDLSKFLREVLLNYKGK